MDGFEKLSLNNNGTRFKGEVRTGFAGAAELCAALDGDEVTLFKNSRKIRAAAVNGFFVKRFNLPGVWNQLRRNFKCGRPWIVMRMAEALKRAGVNTPAIHAALSGFSGVRRRDYLISDLVPADFVQLDRIAPQLMSSAELWEMLEGVVIPEVVKLHDCGIIHGDLSLRNIYGTADRKRVCFIDLDGAVQQRGRVNLRHREREVARLISSYCRSYAPETPEKLIAQAVAAYCKYSGTAPDESNVRREVNYFLDNHKYIRV